MEDNNWEAEFDEKVWYDGIDGLILVGSELEGIKSFIKSLLAAKQPPQIDIESIVGEFEKYFITDDGDLCGVANDLVGTRIQNWLRTKLTQLATQEVAKREEMIKEATDKGYKKGWNAAIFEAVGVVQKSAQLSNHTK